MIRREQLEISTPEKDGNNIVSDMCDLIGHMTTLSQTLMEIFVFISFSLNVCLKIH